MLYPTKQLNNNLSSKQFYLNQSNKPKKMSQNTEAQMMSSKHKTIQEYINQNLQLKTLKIKNFSFSNSFSAQIRSSKKLRNSQTARQVSRNRDQVLNQFSVNLWQPKLNHRKIMNQPKVLLSVEKRKTKTSQSNRRANSNFAPPTSRLGFRGEKVRSHSFYMSHSQQKMPKKLIIDKSIQPNQKSVKKVPNLHFNYKYIMQRRKQGNEQLSVQQRTKKGSNQGYFACFGSQNFKKYVQKNLYRPQQQASILRQNIMYKKSQMQERNQIFN